jgi:transposase
MKDTKLYQQILGLKSPWEVTGVELSMETGEVVVRVATTETVWGCPECSARMHVNEKVTRRWRHLDTCQFKTVIEADVPRVRCREHGTLTVRVPWAEPYGRFTALFEQVALLLMGACSTSAAAKHLRISWDEADHIKERAVRRGLARKKPVRAKAVCVDEKAVGAGHDYVTVVTRVPEEGRPFVDHVADGREKAALDGYWRLPSTGPLEDIRCASMDMWRPYIASAMGALPGGGGAVTHDPFHLVRHMNEAVDKVRRREQPLLGERERAEMKGTRFMWLYGFESLPGKWSQRMQALKDGKTRTARAWRLKELFRAFYQCEGWAQAAAYFDDWYRAAVRCRLEPVVKVARMIKAHLPQVLNYFVHKVTNSFSEGVNGIIQGLIGRARGYRSRERLKRDIYFHMGNLDMLPSIQGFNEK